MRFGSWLLCLSQEEISHRGFPGATLYPVKLQRAGESRGETADSALFGWNQTRNRIFNAAASARREAAGRGKALVRVEAEKQAAL